MKVVNIINTSGLIYDDRLIKESKTLLSLGVDVKILAFERNNRKGKGLFQGIPYKTIRLITRNVFPQPRKLLFLKAVEFNLKVFLGLISNVKHVVWIHNIEMWGAVLFAIGLKKIGLIKGVIWDQHELPPSIVTQKKILKKIFAYTCRNCDFVISANQSRLDYLVGVFENKIGTKHLVINNYPTKEIISSPSRELPCEVSNWLDSGEYVLFQGHAWKERKIIECARAIKLLGEYKLLIVGPISESILAELQLLFGARFEQEVYLTGMVPQEDLYIFIDNCFASLIFYGNIDMNNWLCEPNRFYQAICREKPVVCGANPPMKSIVENFTCGYATNDDGSNYQNIGDGIQYIKTNLLSIQTSLKKISKNLVWGSNIPAFQKIVNILS